MIHSGALTMAVIWPWSEFLLHRKGANIHNNPLQAHQIRSISTFKAPHQGHIAAMVTADRWAEMEQIAVETPFRWAKSYFFGIHPQLMWIFWCLTKAILRGVHPRGAHLAIWPWSRKDTTDLRMSTGLLIMFDYRTWSVSPDRQTRHKYSQKSPTSRLRRPFPLFRSDQCAFSDTEPAPIIEYGDK